MSFTTSGVSCDTSLGTDSDDFSDVSFFVIDDEPVSQTPPPTSDSGHSADADVTDDLPLLILQLPQDEFRPETSTSSLFSFVTENANQNCQMKRCTCSSLRLPLFEVAENPRFFRDESASNPVSPIRRFVEWTEEYMPRNSTFSMVNAEELARNPRVVRSEPEIPSLFKKRENGCGYCRSVGYLGWQTHTRQRCQQLRRLAACKICGATGAMNHTETYCPEKPPVYLPHSSRFLRSLENRRSARDYQFFTKYASLIEAIYSTSNDNLLF